MVHKRSSWLVQFRLVEMSLTYGRTLSCHPIRNGIGYKIPTCKVAMWGLGKMCCTVDQSKHTLNWKDLTSASLTVAVVSFFINFYIMWRPGKLSGFWMSSIHERCGRQNGDTDSSRTSGLTSGFHEFMNVHHGIILRKWQCTGHIALKRLWSGL